jgi:hypothetical protein
VRKEPADASIALTCGVDLVEQGTLPLSPRLRLGRERAAHPAEELERSSSCSPVIINVARSTAVQMGLVASGAALLIEGHYDYRQSFG